jgi:hypothetical protein
VAVKGEFLSVEHVFVSDFYIEQENSIWRYCHPDESDGKAFLLLYEAQVGDPVHEVEEENRTTASRKLLQKGFLAG